MKRISQLKNEALEALHGNFNKGALTVLICMLIGFGVSTSTLAISGVDIIEYYSALFTFDTYGMLQASSDANRALSSSMSLLFNLLIVTPLSLGMINSFRVLYESRKADNAIIKNTFKLVFNKRYISIVAAVLVFSLLVILLLVPGAIVISLISFLFDSVVALVIGGVLIAVYTLWIVIMYSQIGFILIDEPQMDILDVMRQSRTLMKDRKWKYFGMMISFIGWALLCILTLGIGFFWLIPYIRTTQAVFYCDIRDTEKAKMTEQA